MIFANHAHVFPEDIKPNGTLDKLKELMEDCGIDKCVAFAPFSDRFEESGHNENQNDWLAAQLKGQTDIIGFGTINFNSTDLKAEVDRIEQLGFRGIKIHPPYQEIDIDSEEAFKVYQRAEELGLFISFHCGMHWHRLKGVRPILFDEVAWNFPNLRFSLEHIGGYHFFNEALAVICNNMRSGTQPRVFSGWTSVSDMNGPDAWSLTEEQLETVILQTGDDRSIFGLDFPYKNSEYIKYEINRIKRLNISDNAKENIFGKTLSEILNV
jgi:predicted TIM-barrel fold metal-dependent hydrolase